MRIAINTRFLLPRGLEGIGQYTYRVCEALVRAHPEDEFFFLFDRPYDARYVFANNVTPVVIGPQARHPAAWWWWFEVAVPRALRRYGIDVFFSPDSYCSLRTRVPTVLTFHDLGYLHYPEQIPWWGTLYYRRYFPRYVARADRVVAISEFVKQDLLQHFDLSADKVVVAHNATGGHFPPVPPARQRAVREQYTDGHPFFLFVGAIQPRKNIRRLLLAFEAFKARTDHPARLVLAGRMAWHTEEVKSTLAQMAHRDAVLFPGFVSEAALPDLLGSALAFVFPSLLEGFGQPLLEAMEAGVPVLTSNVSSLPEVAGGAALLVDPLRVERIREGLERLAGEAELREQLRRRGLERRQAFSWERTAEIVYAQLQAAISARSGK